LLIAGAIVFFSIVSFYSTGQTNPVTGEKLKVDFTIKDEIAMGLQGVASMGPPSLRQPAQLHLDEVGLQLVMALQKVLSETNVEIPYPFEFHLLEDNQNLNTYALPGGQIFITEGLYRRLGNDGQLAGLLAHEMGHVLERHGSQRLASGNRFPNVVVADGMAGGEINRVRAAAWVGNLVNIEYGAQDELESDRWGIELMVLAGYRPEHMITLLDTLQESAGKGPLPGYQITHPRPANRRKYIDQIVEQKFPNGIPANLQ
jgi:predicted Zn-dependent protease